VKRTYISIAGDMGIEEGLPCSVCGHVETDILYFPVEVDDRQAYWIKSIWVCDPYVDFHICEACMEGHCGAVPGFNADNWLEDRIKEFKTRRAI
jgi:hypothetical protein